MSEKIFLIDICGTIFNSNTTFDFIRFWFGNTQWYKRMQKLRKYRFVGYLNNKIHKVFDVDLIRQYAISKLCGYSEQELLSMSEKFYDDFLLLVINDNIIELIEKKRREGAKLVIASATLDCISKEVAKRLNIGIQYSSALDYKDGVCQGKLKSDLLASKLCNLKSMGLDLSFDFDVVTDNYSDSDIISKAEHAFLIQYTGKPNKWSRYLNNETLKKCELIKV